MFRPAYFRPAGSKRTTFRFASLTLRTSPRAGAARPGFRPAYFRPAGSKRTTFRFASLTLRNAPRAGVARPRFRPAYFRPAGSKRTTFRFASLTLRLRPVRATPARGSAWLIFALRAQNAHAPGPLKRTLRTSPRAGVARPRFRMAYFRPAGSKRTASRFASLTLRNAPRSGHARPRFRPAYWPVGPNARPSGSLRLPSDFAPCGRGPPGVPAGVFSPCGLKTHLLQVRTGWTRVLVRRGC